MGCVVPKKLHATATSQTAKLMVFCCFNLLNNCETHENTLNGKLFQIDYHKWRTISMSSAKQFLWFALGALYSYGGFELSIEFPFVVC